MTPILGAVLSDDPQLMWIGVAVLILVLLANLADKITSVWNRLHTKPPNLDHLATRIEMQALSDRIEQRFGEVIQNRAEHDATVGVRLDKLQSSFTQELAKLNRSLGRLEGRLGMKPEEN